MNAKPSRLLPLLALAAAFAGALVAYGAALHGPFMLDDFDAIFPLARMHAAGAAWLDLLREAPPHIRMRWLSNLSFLASHAWSGGEWPPTAYAFKAGNLALHLACGLAAAALSRRLALLAGENAARAAWIAALAAAFFLLHPLLVSTVLYPVQRMAQLATLFLLLAAYAYAGWRARYATLSPARHALGVASVLLFAALAFFSKESGALAPLLVLAVELCLFRWPARESPQRARFDTGFGLACAAPLVLGAVALGLRWPSIAAGYARRDFTLGERLLTEVHVMGDYLAQIVWPRIGAMGLMRDDFPLQAAIAPTTIALLALFAALVAAAFALRRRAPLVALGVLWFFAAHALESTFIALELVFEHRNYLAIFGPALAVAALLMRLPRVGPALGAAAAIVLALLAAQRADDWRSYDAWLASEVANHPRSLRAGTERMLHLATRGDTADAVAERERLAAALPRHAQPAMLKLAFACSGGPLTVALFTPEESSLLRTGDLGKDALHVYSGLLERTVPRCVRDWAAFSDAAMALAANPSGSFTAPMRANWWRFAARARLELDDWRGVRVAVEQAVKLETNDPRDWLLLAEAALRTGDREAYLAARRQFLALVQGRPGALAADLARLDRLAGDAR